MKLNHWQNIFHVIANANSLLQQVTQIKNRTMTYVNVCAKGILLAKTIAVGSLAHALVKTAGI